MENSEVELSRKPEVESRKSKVEIEWAEVAKGARNCREVGSENHFHSQILVSLWSAREPQDRLVLSELIKLLPTASLIKKLLSICGM